MKNCELFVSGPKLTIDNIPALQCLFSKFSPENVLPSILNIKIIIHM